MSVMSGMTGDIVTSTRATPRTAVVARSELSALVILTTLTMAVRAWLGVIDPGPTLYFDEAYYIENARSIFHLASYSTAIYPPLYSVLIAAGLTQAAWYPATMAISAAASGLAVPATWFLARSLGARWPLAAATIVALLPAGYAYSQYLLSENLSTPLFILALALAVRGRQSEGWIVGISAAALFLTKYIALPAVPLLCALWLLRVWQNDASRRHARSLAAVALRPVMAVVVLIVGWLIYAIASGFALRDAIGLTSATRRQSTA